MKYFMGSILLCATLALSGCANGTSTKTAEANENVEIASMGWTEKELEKVETKTNTVDQKTKDLKNEIEILKRQLEEQNTVIFSDVPKDYWAYSEIMELYRDNIISGYPAEGKFYPDRSITRYQAASMLIKEFNLPLSKSPSIFNDVPPGHWAEEIVMTAYEAGFFRGSNGNFMPGQDMARRHMALVLQRAYELEEVPGAPAQTFHDVPEESESYPAVKVLSQHGITVVANGYFRPNEPTRRSQFAAFMSRARN